MNARPEVTTIIHHADGEATVLKGTGYATRCAAHIAHENLPDARWALEVLNRYGHLVPHPADDGYWLPARAKETSA
jgi:hypothetical protein